MKSAVRRAVPMKIIIGAAETSQLDWYSTNEQWLDITNTNHWKRLFHGRRLLTHVLAEHVFEHLTSEGAAKALNHIADHLISGGRVRIAVPDGYHPDEEYRRHVDIGGIGADALDHKQFFNADSLTDIFTNSGFEVELIEGYDKAGTLICRSWRKEDGFVQRSRQNVSHNDWGFIDANTSLIIDGVYN